MPGQAFYFLRHGETRFNLERRFQGSIDVPLNETGKEQARLAAKILTDHPFSRIISSPASRARKTAEIVAQSSGKQIHLEQDLMEFSVGSLEGQLIDSARKSHGLDENDSYMKMLPDDADQWHEFVPRVTSAVKKWTERYPEETLLFASHGLVFCALAEYLAGEETYSRNAEPHFFKLSGSGWKIKSI